jgi:hypothetical protein
VALGLACNGISTKDRDWLSRRWGFYRLDVSRDDVDVWWFRGLRYQKAVVLVGQLAERYPQASSRSSSLDRSAIPSWKRK